MAGEGWACGPPQASLAFQVFLPDKSTLPTTGELHLFPWQRGLALQGGYSIDCEVSLVGPGRWPGAICLSNGKLPELVQN